MCHRESVRIAAGDRFRFRGLDGQERIEHRMPGSGSVGWLIEVVAVSPWGGLSFRCAPDATTLEQGAICAVGYGEALDLICTGVWTPDEEG